MGFTLAAFISFVKIRKTDHTQRSARVPRGPAQTNAALSVIQPITESWINPKQQPGSCGN